MFLIKKQKMYKSIFRLFFLFFIFISKEFLVLNEEVLVLISFSIFLFLIINYAKASINDSLNLKLEEINNEFDFYKNLQKQTIYYLINFYKKQILLAQNVKKILVFNLEQLYFIEIYSSNLWVNGVKLNFEDKLKKLVNYELQKNIYVQNFYLSNLRFFFNEKYILLKKFANFNSKVQKLIVLKSLNKFKNL